MKKVIFIFALLLILLNPSTGIAETPGFGDSDTPTPGFGDSDTQTSGGRGGSQSVSILNPLGEGTTITSFFLDLIQILLVFAIPLIVFFIIYAGFLMVTANGKAEQISKGKTALLYAVIGGLLILGANLILTVIQGTVDSFRV